jgi:hypothetical protein
MPFFNAAVLAIFNGNQIKYAARRIRGRSEKAKLDAAEAGMI